MLTLRRLLHCTLALFTTIALVEAYPRNQTVDDASAGKIIQYSPPDQWSSEPGCKGCSLRPDVSKTQGGTWHDTTYKAPNPPRSIVINFTGTAIYVFNILANGPTGSTVATATHLRFELDNVQDSEPPFEHDSDGSGKFQYNVAVYAKDGLTYSPHTLIIKTAEDSDSVFLFDYIVYTTEEDGPSTTDVSTPSGAISLASSSTSLSSATALSPVPSTSEHDTTSSVPNSALAHSTAPTSSTSPHSSSSGDSDALSSPTVALDGRTAASTIGAAQTPQATPSIPASASLGQGGGSDSARVGPIVGGVLGGFVALGLVAALAVYAYRLRAARSRSLVPHPFEDGSWKRGSSGAWPYVQPSRGDSPTLLSSTGSRFREYGLTALPTKAPPAIGVHPSCVFPSPPGSPTTSVYPRRMSTASRKWTADVRPPSTQAVTTDPFEDPTRADAPTLTRSPTRAVQEAAAVASTDEHDQSARLKRLRQQVLRSSVSLQPLRRDSDA